MLFAHDPVSTTLLYPQSLVAWFKRTYGYFYAGFLVAGAEVHRSCECCEIQSHAHWIGGVAGVCRGFIELGDQQSEGAYRTTEGEMLFYQFPKVWFRSQTAQKLG